MEAILQENPDTLIFAGNVGNSGNSEAISSSGTASGEIDLFPNGVLEAGNNWEQAEAKVDVPAHEDAPGFSSSQPSRSSHSSQAVLDLELS